MPVIGVTGGIASGKSTVTQTITRILRQQNLGKVSEFSADEHAHWLLENDPRVFEEVLSVFGPEVTSGTGGIDRGKLRNLVFENDGSRKQLEAILHPRIRKAWMSLADDFRGRTNYLVAEIPLLYETNSEGFIDCVVVVEAGTRLQIERLSTKRGWSSETAHRVINAQMSADEKIRRADFLILNNHTEKLLADQIDLTVQALFTRYA